MQTFPLCAGIRLLRSAILTVTTRRALRIPIWASRSGQAAGAANTSVERLIEITAEDNRKAGEDCPPDDLKYFVEKWGSKYGHGFDTSYMRAINVDFDPEANPEFVDNRTVFNNSPEFVWRMAMQGPPHLINSINGVNIVRYKGEFLNVPNSRAAGSANTARPKQTRHQGLPHPCYLSQSC